MSRSPYRITCQNGWLIVGSLSAIILSRRSATLIELAVAPFTLNSRRSRVCVTRHQAEIIQLGHRDHPWRKMLLFSILIWADKSIRHNVQAASHCLPLGTFYYQNKICKRLTTMSGYTMIATIISLCNERTWPNNNSIFHANIDSFQSNNCRFDTGMMQRNYPNRIINPRI
jgi:hypothetical protein